MLEGREDVALVEELRDVAAGYVFGLGH